jgi:hypothetical protein
MRVEFTVPLMLPIEVAEALIEFRSADLPFKISTEYQVSYPLVAEVEAESREDAVKQLLRAFGYVDDVTVYDGEGSGDRGKDWALGSISDYQVFMWLDEVEAEQKV